MLPVKHLAPKILKIMAAQRVGWALPTFHKKDGATTHPGACKHSLQYDGWPDGCFEVRIGTLNFGSLSAND